jgi:hypothetical protein
MKWAAAICVLIMALGISCGSKAFVESSDLDQALRASVGPVNEVTSLYPDSVVGIIPKGRRYRNDLAEVTAIVNDRYELMVKMTFEFETKPLRVTRQGIPEFILQEIESVEGMSAGRVGISYSGKPTSFSASDWKKIVQAGGNFSAAGIQVKTNSLAEGIDKLKEYFRNAKHLL